MTLYARSLEIGSVIYNGSVSMQSGGYNGTYGIRRGIQEMSGVSTNYFGTGPNAFTPISGTFWHRGFFQGRDANTFTGNRTLFEYLTGAGVAVLRARFTGSHILQFQYWNGSAWTNIGSSIDISTSTLYKFDLRIDVGSGFAFFLSTDPDLEGSSVLSGTASMPLMTDIGEIRAYNTRDSGNSAQHSEWIWGDETTVGHRYALRPPSGEGTDTAGTGAYTDVDEQAANDTDIVVLPNAGDARTFVHSAMAGVAGLTAGKVKAVQIEARVRNTAGGATNIKARLRVAGGAAQDQAANYAGMGTAFSAYVARWPTNPAGGNWTLASATQVSNEFGLVAAT